MAATITKGQTFGSTEQITSTKLHNLVDLATISGIAGSEISSVLESTITFTGQYMVAPIVTYDNDVVCEDDEVVYYTQEVLCPR